MVGMEEDFKGIELGRFMNSEDLGRSLKKYIPLDFDDIVFFCIGTDKLVGDSYGPLVGTLLKEQGYTNVMGTMEDPIHAENLTEKIKQIPMGKIVIAIDATLGKKKHIGQFSFKKGRLSPGKGVGKALPSVGHFGLTTVVNESSKNPLENQFNLSVNTRLYLILELAKKTTRAIQQAFPLEQIQEDFYSFSNVVPLQIRK